MTDANVRAVPDWWGSVRSIPAGGWVLLLVLHLVVIVLVDTLFLAGSFTAVLLLGALVAAGAWYAGLRVLHARHGAVPDLRRLPLLWAWLVLLDITGLLNLRFDADVLVPGYLPAVASLADLALRYVFALLPMVVLLDGRGPLRAVRLLHRSWRTVVPVALVVVLGFLSEQVVQLVLVTATTGYQRPDGFVALMVGNLVFSTLRAVLTTAVLYTTYRLATADEPLPA
ncbi:hypothetical protein ACIA8O_30420 [Kitasatospora sp. NPDC051853]|uniref:hypothetical protein n=1 Tax=Kitasatospora sp. NPDC051853 TaxID=3364058 RepID=UPI0037959FE5